MWCSDNMSDMPNGDTDMAMQRVPLAQGEEVRHSLVDTDTDDVSSEPVDMTPLGTAVYNNHIDVRHPLSQTDNIT